MTRPPSGYQLEQAMSVLMSARARLIADGLGDTEIAALIDPDQQTVIEMIHALLRAAVEAAAMERAAADMLEALTIRRKRFATRAGGFRATAFAAMDTLGITKIELPDLTASIRRGTETVLITDEAAIPEAYQKVETRPDRAAIAAAFKRGENVPGAELTNGLPTLSIRSS